MAKRKTPGSSVLRRSKRQKTTTSTATDDIAHNAQAKKQQSNYRAIRKAAQDHLLKTLRMQRDELEKQIAALQKQGATKKARTNKKKAKTTLRKDADKLIKHESSDPESSDSELGDSESDDSGSDDSESDDSGSDDSESDDSEPDKLKSEDSEPDKPQPNESKSSPSTRESTPDGPPGEPHKITASIKARLQRVIHECRSPYMDSAVYHLYLMRSEREFLNRQWGTIQDRLDNNNYQSIEAFVETARGVYGRLVKLRYNGPRTIRRPIGDVVEDLREELEAEGFGEFWIETEDEAEGEDEAE